MRTKLLRLLALAALVTAALSVTVAAPAGVGAYYETPCSNADTNFAGTKLAMASWGPSGPDAQDDNTTAHRGVKATINPNSAFRPCSYTGSTLVGSVAFVALQPSADNTFWDEGNAIIQVGIVRCDNWTACGDSTPHFFVATGGCSTQSHPDTYVPVPQDAGATDDNEHTYEIRHLSSPNEYQFWIDGTHYDEFDIANTSDRISCWINQGQMEATFFGETKNDRDGLGEPAGTSPYQTIFSTVRYRTSDGEANVSPAWGSSENCTHPSYGTGELVVKCDISNAVHDQMYIWSENY